MEIRRESQCQTTPRAANKLPPISDVMALLLHGQTPLGLAASTLSGGQGGHALKHRNRSSTNVRVNDRAFIYIYICPTNKCPINGYQWI